MASIAHTMNLVAAAGLIAANRGLLAVGARTRIDGWRRAAGLVLNTEASTFVLSAFGLDAWSDERDGKQKAIAGTQAHASERLAKFFQRERIMKIAVRRSNGCDAIVQRGSPSYTLNFEAWANGAARFIPPREWGPSGHGPSLNGDDDCEFPLMNIVCRVNDDGKIDMWTRINHVGTDGVPAQEMLTRLEEQWGHDRELRYPALEHFEAHSAARPFGARTDICETKMFVDFSPLLAWRKRENAKLAAPMTISAAVLWWLGKHERFRNLHIGTTVEVAAKDGLGPGVGIVVARAADYFDRADGLAMYVQQFNKDLERTRLRESESCKILDAAAFLPPNMARTVLHHALENDPRAFGSMAVTILKDAKVFGAPIATVGHEYGFIAIGSVALTTSDGKKVGCIMAKGPRQMISEYPRILPEAFACCD